MWGLFIFGTYNYDQSLLSDIYPFIIFLWLNILEKKAMHFLQEKQKSQIENYQSIAIKSSSGQMHVLKLSHEFEKENILKSLDKVCKLTVPVQSKGKLIQKGSLPLEQLCFGDNTLVRGTPSKSLDVFQMQSPKPSFTFELQGKNTNFPLKEKNLIDEEKKEDDEEKKEDENMIFDISRQNNECDIFLQSSSLNLLKIDDHFLTKKAAGLLKGGSLISNESKNIYKLQNFYKNKKAYLKYEIILGCQYFLIRFFLLIFLVNSNLTNSVFSFLYLVIVVVICFHKNKAMINFIKDFTLTIIPIHYVFFLINLNNSTSPRPIPKEINSFQDVSLVGYMFGNDLYLQYSSWLKFLGLGLDTSDFTSFVLVSIIICFLQIYFMYYFTFVEYIIKSIDKRYQKYEKALEDQESQLINYKNWKKPENKFLNQFYNFLHVGVHLILIFFLCFLTIIDFSLPNFLLFVLYSTYIILCELGFKWPYTFEKLSFIKSYFRVIQIVEIFFLFLIHIFYIPEISDICTFPLCLEINTYMSKYDKLIALLVLQLGIDLISYDRFAKVCYDQCSKKMLRVYNINLNF